MGKTKIAVPKDSDAGKAVEISPQAQALVDTLQESNTARKEIKAVLHEILKQPDTIVEIKDIINEIDRDAVKSFWKKFGFATWSGIMFVVGIVVTVLITNALHSTPKP